MPTNILVLGLNLLTHHLNTLILLLAVFFTFDSLRSLKLTYLNDISISVVKIIKKVQFQAQESITKAERSFMLDWPIHCNICIWLGLMYECLGLYKWQPWV